jgi:glycerol-3-phosphate O-acyltransferase/dihydroxyacetone phosphate acyltransferase
MDHHPNGFRPGSVLHVPSRNGAGACQTVGEQDGMAGTGSIATALRTVLADAFYRGMRLIMLAAIGVHFRRAVVVGRERFPAKGPALLVANHPSTWSDVLLLDGLLGRRLHFLAEIGQFRPWPRRVLISLFGTLPVFISESGRFSSARNETTFRRCRDLFARGETVAIFPEGTSRTDRTLMPLKRGAARLALSYARKPSARPSFTLIPVALRYSDRTAFRSDVIVTIGQPIALSELRDRYGMEEAWGIEPLTERLADALR